MNHLSHPTHPPKAATELPWRNRKLARFPLYGDRAKVPVPIAGEREPALAKVGEGDGRVSKGEQG